MNSNPAVRRVRAWRRPGILVVPLPRAGERVILQTGERRRAEMNAGWLVVLVARWPKAAYKAAQKFDIAIPIPTPW